jgi:hypothetical protein
MSTANAGSAPDITPQEVAWFNEDCALAEARIRDWIPLSPLVEDQAMNQATSSIVSQLYRRWFGVDYSPANMERIRELRDVIGVGPGNDSTETLPPHVPTHTHRQ